MPGQAGGSLTETHFGWKTNLFSSRRYTSGVSEFGDDRARTLSLEDDRAAIRARQQAVQATSLGLRLGLASSISRDLHSSSRTGIPGSISEDSLSNSLRGNDFNPDLSAADISASSARGGNIGFTFPSLSYDETGSTMQGDTVHSQGDAIPDPDTSQLSRVVGSVIEPVEKRQRWHCSGCGLIFPRDSTIYAPPTTVPRATAFGSVRAPGTGSDPLDTEPTSYFCRPCYAERFSLGLCAECGGDVLGTTRQDGAFVRAASTDALYHERCYACVHCGIAAAPPPVGDAATIVIGMHGLPLCEECFDNNPQAPRQVLSVWKHRTSNPGFGGSDADATSSASPRKDARAKAVDELRERLNRAERPALSHSATGNSARPISTSTLSYPSDQEATPRARSGSFPTLLKTQTMDHSMHSHSRPVTMRPKELSRSPRVKDVAASFEARTPTFGCRREVIFGPPSPPAKNGLPSSSAMDRPRYQVDKQSPSVPPCISMHSTSKAQDPTMTVPNGSRTSPVHPSLGLSERDPTSPLSIASSLDQMSSGRALQPASPTRLTIGDPNLPDLRDLPQVTPVLSDPPSLLQGSRTNAGDWHPDEPSEKEKLSHAADRHAPHLLCGPSMGTGKSPTSVCARCGESPFAGPQRGAQESVMVTVSGGLGLHVECFTCNICNQPIDGSKPFVHAPSNDGTDQDEKPAQFAHPKCAPRFVPIRRQFHAPLPASPVGPVEPRDHATFQRTPKPASGASPQFTTVVTDPRIESLPKTSLGADSPPNFGISRRYRASGSSQREAHNAVNQFRPSAGAAPLTRSSLFGPRLGTGGIVPPSGKEPKSNPTAGFFARTSGPALGPSGKGNLNASAPRSGGYGGMTPCPLCQRMLTSIEGVPGPRGTRWHKACLVCRGTLPSGKPCSKSLDSGAKVDPQGRVLCRECFDSAARATRRQAAPAEATGSTRFGRYAGGSEP